MQNDQRDYRNVFKQVLAKDSLKQIMETHDFPICFPSRLRGRRGGGRGGGRFRRLFGVLCWGYLVD